MFRNNEDKYAQRVGPPSATVLKDELTKNLQKRGYPFYTANVPLSQKFKIQPKSELLEREE